MLIEHRIYTTKTEFAHEFPRRYLAEGIPIQRPVLGDLVAFLVPEVGPQEELVVIWRYKDFNDRTARRKQLSEIPDWRAFVASTAPMVLRHENRLMRSVAGL